MDKEFIAPGDVMIVSYGITVWNTAAGTERQSLSQLGSLCAGKIDKGDVVLVLSVFSNGLDELLVPRKTVLISTTNCMGWLVDWRDRELKELLLVPKHSRMVKRNEWINVE